MLTITELLTLDRIVIRKPTTIQACEEPMNYQLLHKLQRQRSTIIVGGISSVGSGEVMKLISILKPCSNQNGVEGWSLPICDKYPLEFINVDTTKRDMNFCPFPREELYFVAKGDDNLVDSGTKIKVLTDIASFVFQFINARGIPKGYEGW